MTNLNRTNDTNENMEVWVSISDINVNLILHNSGRIINYKLWDKEMRTELYEDMKWFDTDRRAQISAN